ncbi:MAG: hypothetical protein HIU81_09395 [Acidobacteria bacterium]|nr:hypothetical protein [Acidobacteriota bacterium]
MSENLGPSTHDDGVASPTATPASPSVQPVHTPDEPSRTATGPSKVAVTMRWIVGVLALLVVLAVVYLILAATIPVVWADTIGNQVNGQLGAGIPVGMFYGFVFSFVPVLVAWQARYKRMHLVVRIIVLAVAVILTVPNLLTLAILNGTSQDAAKAASILTNRATWFGGWSVSFMIVGVVLAVLVMVLSSIWRSRGRKIRSIKDAEKAERRKEREAKEAARTEERQAAKAARNAERAARNHDGQ